MKALLAVAVLLMLVGAAMLLAGVGASALWISLVTVGVGLVVIASHDGRRTIRR